MDLILHLTGPLAWAVVALLQVAIYIIGLCIYRLLFHPYAKYPGPLLARISNFHAAYHAWTGDIHVDMWRCHQRFGTVVRYAPDRILINTPEALRDIYGHKANVQKSSTYDALIHRAPNILTLRDKKRHGRRRRVLSQALSDSAISAFGPAIMKNVRKFVDAFSNLPLAQGSSREEGWSIPVDVARRCDYLTFDIMASVVFSASPDLLGNHDHRGVIDAILDSNVRMGVLYQYPTVRHWKVHKHFFPAAIAARGTLISFASRMVGGRMMHAKLPSPDGGAAGNDVFSFLTGATDPETGSQLSPNELGAESTTLIVAGSDTTSTVIAGTLFYLAKHPQHLRRAQQEVRNHFASPGEVVLGTKLCSCAFLSACINETMRLSPSVGASLWRQAGPGGLVVDGHFVPAGYDVGVGIWSVQHLESHYPDAFAFKPERWLVGGEEERARLLDAFTPFSRGPRSCIGKGIATAELMLTFASVLWELDFRFAGGKIPDGNFQLRDHVTGAKNGPVLQFRVMNAGDGIGQLS